MWPRNVVSNEHMRTFLNMKFLMSTSSWSYRKKAGFLLLSKNPCYDHWHTWKWTDKFYLWKGELDVLSQFTPNRFRAFNFATGNCLPYLRTCTCIIVSIQVLEERSRLLTRLLISMRRTPFYAWGPHIRLANWPERDYFLNSSSVLPLQRLKTEEAPSIPFKFRKRCGQTWVKHLPRRLRVRINSRTYTFFACWRCRSL